MEAANQVAAYISKLDLLSNHMDHSILADSHWVVFVLKKVSLKQNKSHTRSLDLHLVFINESLPE